MTADLARTIDEAWEARDSLNFQTQGAVREAVEAAILGLDSSHYRVAEKIDGDWHVHQWLKTAVLLQVPEGGRILAAWSR